jgi:hypothetical protein
MTISQTLESMGVTTTDQVKYITDADVDDKPLGLKKGDKDAFVKARDALGPVEFGSVEGWAKMDDLVKELGGLDAKAVKKQKVGGGHTYRASVQLSCVPCRWNSPLRIPSAFNSNQQTTTVISFLSE